MITDDVVLDLMDGYYPPHPSDFQERRAYWIVLSRRLSPEAAGGGDRQRGLFELLSPAPAGTLAGMMESEYLSEQETVWQRELSENLYGKR
jgi:hypothetical protein